MKRYLAYFLALVLMISVIFTVACSEKTDTSATTVKESEKETQVQTTAEKTEEVTTEEQIETTAHTEDESTYAETDKETEKVVFEELDMAKIDNHEKIPLWGDGEAPFEIKEEKVKARFAQTATIQAYLVEGSEYCIIVYPGGGYSTITAAEAGDIAKAYNEKGISAFVCNYRVNQYTDEKLGYVAYHRDAFLADGQRAVQYVRYYASAFGINPDKIGVIGFSAGGHLAMYVCEHECEENYLGDEIGKVSSRPNLCILSYAVTVLKPGISSVTTQHFFHSQEERTNQELIDFYSYTYAPEKMPPTMFWYSLKDTSVNYTVCSEEFALKLSELGITNEVYSYSDGGHGVGLAKDYPACSQWFDTSIDFISRMFGD